MVDKNQIVKDLEDFNVRGDITIDKLSDCILGLINNSVYNFADYISSYFDDPCLYSNPDLCIEMYKEYIAKKEILK